MLARVLHSAGYIASATKWRRIREPRICADFISHAKTRSVGNVFSYGVVFPAGTLTSLWLLTFYQRLHFIVHLQPIGAV